MTKNNEAKIFEEIRNVERAMASRLADLPEDELLAELHEDGIDPKVEADQVGRLFERAVGKARMAAARAALSANRSQHRGEKVINFARPGNSVQEAKGLTMAARHGTEQTDADVRTVAEDLAELHSFEDESSDK